jgi:hypothetical protein
VTVRLLLHLVAPATRSLYIFPYANGKTIKRFWRKIRDILEAKEDIYSKKTIADEK